MTAHLAPCPFCGGSAVTVTSDEWGRPVNRPAAIQCIGCSATGPMESDEGGARVAWDRRADLGEMLAQAWRAADAARADLAEVTRQRDELLARLAEVVHGHTEKPKQTVGDCASTRSDAMRAAERALGLPECEVVP